jgi:hypothetical protein
MYCPLLLYDVVYEYCLNDNFGLSKYYSSIATEIDENYLNQIYNLTNTSYNHSDNNSDTNISEPHSTKQFILDDHDATNAAESFIATLNTDLIMNDSLTKDDSIQESILGKRTQRRHRSRLNHETNINSTYLPTCTCHCTCDSMCFCGTLLCNEIRSNHSNETLTRSSLPTEHIIQENLQAALIKRYSEIILFFHVQRGHINFKHVIDDFRHDVYDEDPYLEKDQEYLEKLKAISHNVSPTSFLCVTCPQYKSKKKGRVTVSNRIPIAPFKKGYVDVIGPFPVGWGGRPLCPYLPR